MLLKESTSKEVLKIPLAGVPIVEPSKGNMSVAFSFGAFLDRPLNWNKSRDGLFLDMVTDDQVRRAGALPVTFSDTPLFGDKVTDLGLPAKMKKKTITKNKNNNSIKHALTYLHLLNSFDKQVFFTDTGTPV